MKKAWKHILLVEDDDNDAELTKSILVDNHLVNEIHRVCDGEEALFYLRKEDKYLNRETGNPMIILLDIKMPKIDGLEVLAEIRKDPKLKYIPVIMLTSSAEDQDLMNSYKLGINAYVVKPVDLQRFVSAITELGIFWGLYNQPPPNHG